MIMGYSSSSMLLRYSGLRKLQAFNRHLLTNILRSTPPPPAAAACYSSLSGDLSHRPSSLSSDKVELPLSDSQYPALVFPSAPTTSADDRELKRGESSFRLFSPARNQFFTGQLTDPEAVERISDSEAYPVFSNNGWLTYLKHTTDCSLFLVNALSPSPSHKNIIMLPSFHTFKTFQPLEKEQISEGPDLGPDDVGKMALSSSPMEDDCLVMLWLGFFLRGDYNDKLKREHLRPDFAFCRIGDTHWTFLERPINQADDDLETGEIIYSKRDRLFYADRGDELEAFDLNNTSSPVSFKCPIDYPTGYLSEFEKEVDDNAALWTFYLVESPQGDLLKVERYYACVGKDGRMLTKGVDYSDSASYFDIPYRSLYFRVYKLNVEKQIAEDFNLEGMAVFVGKNQPFSVSVRDYPGLTPNCIYFTDDLSNVLATDSKCPHGGHDNGVYNLLTHTVSPLFQPFDFKRIQPAPMWVSRP